MKKLAILLSLVMVLGLAVNASAAVTVSGEIKMTVNNEKTKNFGTEEEPNVKDIGVLDTFAIPDVKLNFVGAVNDNLKVTVQTNGVSLKNHWLDYKVGDVTVKAGKFRASRGGNVDSLAANYSGAGASFNFSGVKAMAVLGLDEEPDSNTFAFNGSFAPVNGLTVYGDFVLSTRKDAKSSYAVEAAYDLAGFTVYGEIGKKADADLMAVGATTTVGAFDLTLDYDVEGEEFAFNAETNYDGLIVGADFTKAKDVDMKIVGYLKVKF